MRLASVSEGPCEVIAYRAALYERLKSGEALPPLKADEAPSSLAFRWPEVLAFSFWSYVAESLRGAQGRRFRLERVARIKGEVGRFEVMPGGSGGGTCLCRGPAGATKWRCGLAGACVLAFQAIGSGGERCGRHSELGQGRGSKGVFGRVLIVSEASGEHHRVRGTAASIWPSPSRSGGRCRDSLKDDAFEAQLLAGFEAMRALKAGARCTWACG